MTVDRSVTARLAVVAILAVLAFAGRSVPGRPAMERLVPADADGAQWVRVSSAAADLRLVRDGSAWITERDGRFVPARSDRVRLLLETLGAGRVVREVTADPLRFRELGVGPLSPSLTFGLTGTDVTLRLGLQTATGGYVAPDGRGVVETDAGLWFFVAQPRAYWEYLRLFPEDVAVSGVIRAEVRYGYADADGRSRSGDYAVRQEIGPDGERWFVERSGVVLPAATREVRVWLRELVDLVGSGFGSPSGAEGAAQAALFLELSDGRRYSASVHEYGDRFLAVPEGSGLPGAEYGGLTYVVEPAVLLRVFTDAGSLVAPGVTGG